MNPYRPSPECEALDWSEWVRYALGGFALFLAFGCFTTGCLESAPIVPVTPANQAQVNACQSTALLHNDVVVGDYTLGGVTSGLAATAAALTDPTAQKDVALAASIVGGFAIAGTAIAAWSAANYANSQCPSVVGPLAAPTQAPAQLEWVDAGAP